MEGAAAVAALGDLPLPRVLEVGCGSGPLFPLLRQRGWQPLGVETNGAALRRAVRGGGAAVQVDARPWLPMRSACVGAVLAQHLIEHLDRPEEAVGEWRRVLAPGGRLAVLTPNAAHPDAAIFADPDHRDLFTARRLAALLQRVGFQQVAVRALFPYLGATRAGRALSRRAWRLGRVAPFRIRARTLLALATKVT